MGNNIKLVFDLSLSGLSLGSEFYASLSPTYKQRNSPQHRFEVYKLNVYDVPALTTPFCSSNRRPKFLAFVSSQDPIFSSSSYVSKILQFSQLYFSSNVFKGVLHLLPKLACFVSYLKIITIFLKINTCIL